MAMAIGQPTALWPYVGRVTAAANARYQRIRDLEAEGAQGIVARNSPAACKCWRGTDGTVPYALACARAVMIHVRVAVRV